MIRSVLHLFFFLILLLTQPAFGLESSEVSGPHIKLKILSSTPYFKFGEKLQFAVQAIPEPDWHFYWSNPGDSGSSPKFDWSASVNAAVSEPSFPIPDRIPVGPLTNFGYSQQTLILFEVQALSPQARNIELRLDTEFLVCKEECIPANAFLELSISREDLVENRVIDKEISKKFEDTLKRLPFDYPSLNLTASQTDANLLISGTTPVSQEDLELQFFPHHGAIINNAAFQTLNRSADKFTLSIPKSEKGKALSAVEGILVSKSGWVDKGPQAVNLKFTNIPKLDHNNKSKLGLLYAIILAFFAGLILNLMPCVLPVLTIKLFGLIRKADHYFISRLINSLSFCLGVILSFLFLAGLIILAREAGSNIGWGFQLQNPSFVALLTVLTFVMGLNFLGAFEFGSSVQNLLSKAHFKGKTSKYAGSFLDGVLITALATPCTAPFMGSAMAYGLSAPYSHTAIVFTALAIGVSFPFASLNLWAGLARFMPKPGLWMEHLKKLLAFPLFATSVWLIWVLGLQTSVQVVGELLIILLLLSFILFVFGNFITPKTSVIRRLILGIIAITALIFVLIAISRISPLTHTGQSETRQILWQDFSEGKVKELREAGKIIYIDFTAAWCITCQVNKLVALSDLDVVNKFNELGVVALKADWTNKEPDIAQAIQAFGREGVPLNVIYPKNNKQEVAILPQILTPNIVLDALSRANNP
jgi:thiol:disulfide interchange protein